MNRTREEPNHGTLTYFIIRYRFLSSNKKQFGRPMILPTLVHIKLFIYLLYEQYIIYYKLLFYNDKIYNINCFVPHLIRTYKHVLYQ
jgi:hypothetical protein